MPLTGFCKWVFLIFYLLFFWFIILPWVSVSFSLYVLLASFPSCVSSPHSLYHFFCLSCSKSPLFTFVLPWTDLEKPNSSDPWYPVLPPAFPREWTNLMINPVSLIAHTIWQTHTHTPNCLAACQPITTPHLQHRYLSLLPTCVTPCFNLFSATSFFRYNPHLD